jgi:hypothetical protein
LRVTLALATQPVALVFDGVTPAYQDLRAPHAAILPWLINFIAINASVIDMSGSTTSGTVTITWSAEWVVSTSAGVVLTVLSSTSTTAGSQVTFPNAAGGQVQVLALSADLALCTGFCEHTLYLTDQYLNTYKAVWGMLYPDKDSG